jgi:hypothetical protein
LGPLEDKLSNRSDRVALERPQPPDWQGDPYSWILVDEVIYANQSPWPDAANGTGLALHRSAAGRAGNDPANWTAASPTPGYSATVDRDGDGMPDDWETTHALNPGDARDAGLDPDEDGLSNLQEYQSGTDPRAAASRLGFDAVSAEGGSTKLRFQAVAGKSYTVQYREALVDGGWAPLSDVPADSASRPVEIVDPLPLGVRQRYYRLVTPASP